MIIYELTETENHPIYKRLEAENGNRQFDFLSSIIAASIDMGRPFLSQHIIKALNYHAIACLHIAPGEYRPTDVEFGERGQPYYFVPPRFYRVQALMDDFVNEVNRYWDEKDAIQIATFVLWKLNYIHPFINGNGRTSRTAAYYALCVKSGSLLGGSKSLPELIKRDRREYVHWLNHATVSFRTTGGADLAPLHKFIQDRVAEQIASGSPTTTSGSIGVSATPAPP